MCPCSTNTALHSSDYTYFLDESRARALIVHSSLYLEWNLLSPGAGTFVNVIVA